VCSSDLGDQGSLLGFMMDLPRVQEPVEAWSAMVEAAKVFQQSLGGQLVDEHNAVLDDKAFGYIAQQIQDRSRVFAEAGLVPGDEFTKRIFT
jgi:FtsZ-interacting cell division protein ZipA